jgi:ribosomal protein S21
VRVGFVGENELERALRGLGRRAPTCAASH